MIDESTTTIGISFFFTVLITVGLYCVHYCFTVYLISMLCFTVVDHCILCITVLLYILCYCFTVVDLCILYVIVLLLLITVCFMLLYFRESAHFLLYWLDLQ